MAIWDGHQGRKKGQVNPNRFTRTDVSDNQTRRDAAPVSNVSGSSPRVRQSLKESGIEPDAPIQTTTVL